MAMFTVDRRDSFQLYAPGLDTIRGHSLVFSAYAVPSGSKLVC